jgi:NADH-quinone oxidoreductase subunit M
MEFITRHLLSIILLTPVVGALVMLLAPEGKGKAHRWLGLGFSLVAFAFAVLAWVQFVPGQAGFQFEEQAEWYSAINSSFHLGVDGISLTMVLLTTFLVPLAVLASFSIKEQVKAYMILFLLLETGMLGVFLSLDLLLFFVFWEVGLVPMYFLIARWGSANRNYASLKFMLFTIGGSLGLLLATQALGLTFGSFDLPVLFQKVPALTDGVLFGLPVATVKTIAFWAFVVAFAVKVPVWPVHTWLPDAHTEAPTAASMILAGVLLKLGAYGFLRLVLPLFPAESYRFSGALALLATLAIILGALSAFGQTDFKRLVAYSSINHMGFVVLGIAAAAWAASTPNAVIALNGAVLQMVTHGLSSAGMFFLVGVLYERTHTRNLKEYGGLWALAPVYGGVLVFTSMASLGLPGMGGFISEFLVVRGAWPVLTVATALSMIGLFFTGVYVLKALRLVLHGPLNETWQGKMTEIQPRELLVMAPLMAFSLLIGIWPAWLMNVINKAVSSWF